MNTRFIALLMAGSLAVVGAQADDFGTGANQFTMDFVLIGNAGNIADQGGWGAVIYEYRIGTYEVSIAKFNKVYAADNRVGDGDEDYWNTAPKAEGTNVPAARVSWLEAAKFCNWLTSSNAYAGAYLFDAIGTLTNVNRAAALTAYGTVYVIPSEDEWLKAGYFKADGTGYTDWPTGNDVPVAGTDEQYYFKGKPWAVGSGSIENNGTYDMAGNVFEWNEDAADGILDDMAEARIFKGGSYDETASELRHSGGSSYAPTIEVEYIGFRVAAIITLSPPPAPPIITIQNVSAAQREGTKLVDIFYDLSSDASNAVSVALVITNGVAGVSACSCSGDVGSGITTGALKHIVWDAGDDWSGNVAELEFTLFAIDGLIITPATAAVAKTGQTTSYQAGDDGDLQAGVAWPAPRFTETGNGTAIDNLTGLEWVLDPSQMPGNSSTMTWSNAVAFADNDTYQGGGWRLPSYKEMLSLVDFNSEAPALPSGHPFPGIIFSYGYWSGSPSPWLTPSYAFVLYADSGTVGPSLKNSERYVWPVRGGSASSPAPVPQTGQTTSFVSNDDGALQTGTSWPSPRFIDLGDGVVRDNLTGLEWANQPHALAGNTTTLTWSNAVAFCASLNLGSTQDWRLPNVKEMESIIALKSIVPINWLNSAETPFNGILQNNYWTGTTKAGSTNKAWIVNTYSLSISYVDKTGSTCVWPVRTGSAGASLPAGVSAVSDTDARDYSLTVSSPFGTPVPGIGTTSSYAWRSVITASVDSVVSSGGTNYSSSGWNGSGAVPILGSATNTGPIILTSVSSSIDWRWIVDEDADRIPDDWELLYYGSTTGAVVAADTDDDGYNTWQEYILGSNPTNGGSSFLFTPGTNPPPGEFSIDFTTVTGRLYTVECTDELGSGDWQSLTNFIGNGSAIQLIDPANIPACFYQIRIDWVE